LTGNHENTLVLETSLTVEFRISFSMNVNDTGVFWVVSRFNFCGRKDVLNA